MRQKITLKKLTNAKRSIPASMLVVVVGGIIIIVNWLQWKMLSNEAGAVV